MEGCLTFQWEGMGGGVVFSWGVHPMGDIGFDGAFSKRSYREASSPCLPTMENPEGDT